MWREKERVSVRERERERGDCRTVASFSHSFSLSHSLTLSLSHSLTLSLSLTLSHSLFLSLSHTHTHGATGARRTSGCSGCGLQQKTRFHFHSGQVGRASVLLDELVCSERSRRRCLVANRGTLSQKWPPPRWNVAGSYLWMQRLNQR